MAQAPTPRFSQDNSQPVIIQNKMPKPGETDVTGQLGGSTGANNTFRLLGSPSTAPASTGSSTSSNPYPAGYTSGIPQGYDTVSGPGAAYNPSTGTGGGGTSITTPNGSKVIRSGSSNQFPGLIEDTSPVNYGDLPPGTAIGAGGMPVQYGTNSTYSTGGTNSTYPIGGANSTTDVYGPGNNNPHPYTQVTGQMLRDYPTPPQFANDPSSWSMFLGTKAGRDYMAAHPPAGGGGGTPPPPGGGQHPGTNPGRPTRPPVRNPDLPMGGANATYSVGGGYLSPNAGTGTPAPTWHGTWGEDSPFSVPPDQIGPDIGFTQPPWTGNPVTTPSGGGANAMYNKGGGNTGGGGSPYLGPPGGTGQPPRTGPRDNPWALNRDRIMGWHAGPGAWSHNPGRGPLAPTWMGGQYNPWTGQGGGSAPPWVPGGGGGTPPPTGGGGQPPYVPEEDPQSPGGGMANSVTGQGIWSHGGWWNPPPVPGFGSMSVTGQVNPDLPIPGQDNTQQRGWSGFGHSGGTAPLHPSYLGSPGHQLLQQIGAYHPNMPNGNQWGGPSVPTMPPGPDYEPPVKGGTNAMYGRGMAPSPGGDVPPGPPQVEPPGQFPPFPAFDPNNPPTPQQLQQIFMDWYNQFLASGGGGGRNPWAGSSPSNPIQNPTWGAPWPGWNTGQHPVDPLRNTPPSRPPGGTRYVVSQEEDLRNRPPSRPPGGTR